MYSPSRQLGNIAEDVAVSYLKSNGFSIKDRNYLKKFGELDIVAERAGFIHFIEVKSKSISRESVEVMDQGLLDKVSRLFSQISFTDKKFNIIISREMNADDYLEENVHEGKRKRMLRTIESYLFEKDLVDREWQIDILAIKLDFSQRTAIIKHIDDVVFD